MSGRALMGFAARLEEDAALRDQVEAIDAEDGPSALAAIARIATDAGYEMSPADLEAGFRALRSGELGAEELDAVSGGTSLSNATTSRFVTAMQKVVPGWQMGGLDPCV